MARDLLMYRKYINIVEAANKGCPIAIATTNNDDAVASVTWQEHQ